MERIDIAYKLSLLSKFLAQPRTGHIYQALHIFKYLEMHINNDFSFDPFYQEFNSFSNLEKFDTWNKRDLCRRSGRYTNKCSNSVRKKCPIKLFCRCWSWRWQDYEAVSNRNNPLWKLSTFAVVFQEAKYSGVFYFWIGVCCLTNRLITLFCYNLRMFGIPLDGQANVFCDNEVVYWNSSFVKSQLKQKHHLICYHLVREAVAARK